LFWQRQKSDTGISDFNPAPGQLGIVCCNEVAKGRFRYWEQRELNHPSQLALLH
jgi:Fe-S cluster biosynthesis and repair protein YggX